MAPKEKPMGGEDRERDSVAPEGTCRAEAFVRLCDLVALLRAPGGCPWDRGRRRDEVGRDLLDEAYEVIEALTGPPAGLREELGDLLFEILLLARMAQEDGDFDIAAVLAGIHEKMVRRHPHVFTDAGPLDVAGVRRNWQRIKNEVEGRKSPSPLLLPESEDLPTLARVQRVSAEASRAGFDWPHIDAVLDKLAEETAEFRSALRSGNPDRVSDEAGDLLFTLVNLCRFARVDAEASLRRALGKFLARYALLEARLADQGRTPADATAAELDRLWNEAKGSAEAPPDGPRRHPIPDLDTPG